MATLIEITDNFTGYHEVVNRVLDEGRVRAPRNQRTVDLGHTTITVLCPDRYQLPVGQGRGISPRVAAVEALQLVGGFSDPALTVWASSHFGRFRENSGHFHGAYGPRVRNQLPFIVDKLLLDTQTRRAVVTLWDPSQDNELGKKDYPCTVALGFELDHRGHLCMNTVMRSNDAWLGLPYDIFQFTQLQLTMAKILDVEVGTYTHTAWSLHIYEEHWALARQLYVPENLPPMFPPRGFGEAGMGLTEVRDRIRMLAYEPHIDRTYAAFELTESEMWYRERVIDFIQPRITTPDLG